MEETAVPEPAAAPLWRRCLGFEAQQAGHCNDAILTPLLTLMGEAPRRVLELGCAGGALGAEVKRRYPQASVVGIEADGAAARMAATRLDRVIHATLEGVDLDALGFVPGEFDTLVAADILEHLVNPWALLVRLRRYLAPGAQVLASIPNIRNIAVISRLMGAGRFPYDERGVLDITHLRFFTAAEVRQMFAETGYAFEEQRAIILPELLEAYQAQSARTPPLMLRFGRLTLADVGADELTELCAAQMLVRCRAP